MKNVSLLLALISTFLFSFPLQAQESGPLPDGVRVYYFHGAYRCVTCTNMEKFTKEVIDSDFASEVKSGKLKFFVFNFEEDSNRVIAQKYGVESSTLLIIKIKSGKEKVTDLTELGFSYAKYDPEKFKEGVLEKLNANFR